MRVRTVASLREFDALAPVWREVMEAGGVTSPFLSHDWFACCWRTAGPNRRRELWLVEDAAGPLALVPLTRWKARVRGLPTRVLAFLDCPDTPFADVMAAGAIKDVLPTLLQHLERERDWDVLALRKLRRESQLLGAIEALLPERFPWRVAAIQQSPYLSLGGTWEDFLRGKTQRFRKTCRSIENRIRRAGTVLLEEHRDVDPDGPTFAEVMEVSAQSWKGERGLAMATMQGMPRFFRELTGRASANRWLHLWILRLDGRAIATEYQIGENGHLHALRADFDAGLAELSPGAYLNQRIIRTLFDRGSVKEYDMGPGTNEYKLRWATGAHDLVAVEVYAPRRWGRLLHGMEARVAPMARRWRARLARKRCG
jgi:CelD/BcsL family acetyltransferase involved in cellulose biosynthesis